MQPLDPFRFLLISFAGWINQHQRDVIDYLQEENRILRDQLGNKRPRLTDDQRRRLALKANKLGRKVLAKLDTLFTPNTVLGWHRKLIARKYDGSRKRGSGRPRVMEQIRELIVKFAEENGTWGYTRKGGIHLLGPATRCRIPGWLRSPGRILLAALTIPEPCRSSTIGSRRKRRVWRFCSGFGGGRASDVRNVLAARPG